MGAKGLQFWLFALIAISLIWVLLPSAETTVPPAPTAAVAATENREPAPIAHEPLDSEIPSSSAESEIEDYSDDYATIEPAENQPDNVSYRIDSIVLNNGGQSYTVPVAIPVNEESQRFGMMNRKAWPEEIKGMLFLFGHEQPRAMWMKNTYLPLDILFLDRAGKVVTIAENTKPLSEETIESKKPAVAALEIPAGSVRAWKISLGDTVQHPFFSRP